MAKNVSFNASRDLFGNLNKLAGNKQTIDSTLKGTSRNLEPTVEEQHAANPEAKETEVKEPTQTNENSEEAKEQLNSDCIVTAQEHSGELEVSQHETTIPKSHDEVVIAKNQDQLVEDQELNSQVSNVTSNSKDEASENESEVSAESEVINNEAISGVEVSGKTETTEQEFEQLETTEEHSQTALSVRNTEKQDNVVKHTLAEFEVTGNARLDKNYEQCGLTMSRANKTFLKRAAIRNQTSINRLTAEILDAQYQVESIITDEQLDKIEEKYYEAQRTNEKVTVVIPKYLKEFLDTTAQEYGLKNAVLFSYYMDEYRSK